MYIPFLSSRIQTFITIASIAAVGFLYATHLAGAQSVEELQTQINSRSQQIVEIEKEIEAYNQELSKLSREKRSLTQELASIAATGKKLEAEVNLNRTKIEETRLSIEELQLKIKIREDQIARNKKAMAKVVNDQYVQDNESLVELLLYYDSISDFFDELATLDQINLTITNYTKSLNILKEELNEERELVIDKKNQLESLEVELRGKIALVEQNKSSQQTLIDQTENEESNYQELLADKRSKKLAFEAEMREAENMLRLRIDKTKIPIATQGVLGWPVTNPIITQYFGNTAFATSNAQVYNGQGHNAIDLGMPTGTSIYSAESGVVLGIGNTDEVCPRASYGRWMLIKHDNGLTTLYAHLSQNVVGQGQRVARGEVVAYSGNTGFSTGPHLHFGVYASDGVQISQLQSRACGGFYTIPLADQRAYLNPLSFL